MTSAMTFNASCDLKQLQQCITCPALPAVTLVCSDSFLHQETGFFSRVRTIMFYVMWTAVMSQAVP